MYNISESWNHKKKKKKKNGPNWDQNHPFCSNVAKRPLKLACLFKNKDFSESEYASAIVFTPTFLKRTIMKIVI